MLHGWRARTHHLTRSRSFLLRTSLIILGAGFGIACLVQMLQAGDRAAGEPGPRIDPLDQQLREGFRRLETANSPQPRALCRWLRQFFRFDEHLGEFAGVKKPTVSSFIENGRLLGFNVRRLIEQHTAAGGQRQLFGDFVIANLDGDRDRSLAAFERVRQVAGHDASLPCARELLGSLLLDDGDKKGALAAFVAEGAFGDAADARESALRLAVEMEDTELLRKLVDQPLWLAAAPPLLQRRIGMLTGEVWLQVKGLLMWQLTHMRLELIGIAFLAAALWLAIFIQRLPPSRWRWAWPVLPVIAGVVSVSLVLFVLRYQESVLGMREDAPFPLDLWYYLAGVGLREELSKLAFFALFLPWLLWKKDEGLALLTGAFVGIGFALEENITYFEGGGGVAFARFLTANFMHASMTAIAGHSLYWMLRARFARAERFVGAFLAMVVAHGLYDYAFSADFGLGSDQAGTFGIFSIIILALLAHRFFDLLALAAGERAGPVSPAAVFLLGSSLLIALSFILAAIEEGGMARIAAVGAECAGVAPVVFLYLRKFDVAR